MKNILCLASFTLIISCAMKKSEKIGYEEIKKLHKDHRYSAAALESFKFEAAYPNSAHMCELWKMQIDYYVDRKSNESYVKKVKEKLDNKCK